MFYKKYSTKRLVFTRVILVLLIITMLTSCAPFWERLFGGSSSGNLIVGKMSSTQKRNAQKLVDKSAGEAEVHVNNGVVQSVLTDNNQLSNLPAEQEIDKFFADNAELYQIDTFDETFSLADQYKYEDGSQVFQYEQIYEGIPVYQADIRVSLDESGVVGMVNSNYVPTGNLPKKIMPKLDTETATLAFTKLGYELVEGYEPELVIYSPTMVNEKGDSFLAWHAKAVSDDFYGSVLLKDSNGSLVSTATDIHNFDIEIRDYENKKSEAFFSIALAFYESKELIVIDDSRNLSRISHLIDQFGLITDYLKIHFNYTKFRKYDNVIRLAINYPVTVFGKEIGPFSGTMINPGLKGSRLITFDYETSEKPIDTFAHEFQHIITDDFVLLSKSEFTAQAAALSEAIPDLFAAVMDYNGDPWIISFSNRIIRDIKSPSDGLASKKPSHMNDFLQPSTKTLSLPGHSDGFGHHNSTIVSHAFYLLSEGGVGPGRKPIHVQGIGIDNTYKIVFQSLARMNNNANFLQARNAMVNTCNSLVTRGELSLDDCNEVKNAFAAVGIGEPGYKLAPRKVTPTNNWFGMGSNTHMRSQNIAHDYKEMANLGVQIVREDLPWAEIQTGIDTYDLNYRDGRLRKALSEARKHDMKVLGMLSYAPNTNIRIDSDTDFVNMWVAYVQKVVDEFGDRIDYWEVGNDINVWWHKVRGKSEFETGVYMNMLMSAYEIIKRKDPSDTVIMGSLVNTDSKSQGLDPFEMINKLRIYRVQNYCDALNLQLFWPGQEPDDKKSNIVFGNAKQLSMAEYVEHFLNESERLLGKRMPLWISSVGYDMTQYKDLEATYGFMSNEMQAVFLIKSYVTLLSIPEVQSVFWYTWHNDETGQQFNLLEAGKKAYGTLTKALSGSQALGRQPVVDVNGNVVESGVDYRFRRPDGKIASYFWATDKRLAEVGAKLIPGDNRTVKIYQPDGLLKDRANQFYSPEDFIVNQIPLIMLGAIAPDAKIVTGEISEDIEYGKVPFYRPGEYKTPEEQYFYLTYATNLWNLESHTYGDRTTYSLSLKQNPDCRIRGFGVADGGSFDIRVSEVEFYGETYSLMTYSNDGHD